jgi:RND family efflux transporter MFP subunit
MQARLEAARYAYEELATGTRQEKIDAARAMVEQLDAAIRLNDHELDDCSLKAPFAGVVSDRFVDEGAVVEPGAPIVRVIESDRLEAWVGVPVDLAAGLQVGQEKQIVVDGSHHTVRIAALLPEVDLATRTRRVVLSVSGASARTLVPGQVVRLETEVETAADGFWLPTAALTRGERGLWSCFAVEPHPEGTTEHRVEPRTVEVLHAIKDRAFVRGTLSAGDLVIASGTHRVVAGQAVQPVGFQKPDRPSETALAHKR